MLKTFVYRLILLLAAWVVFAALWHWNNDFVSDNESLGAAIFLAACALLLFSIARVVQWSFARIAAAYFYRFSIVKAASWIAGRRRVECELRRVAEKLDRKEMRASAIDARSVVIRLDPTQAAYWVDRGVAYYFTGEYDAAISDLSRALEINPDVRYAHRYRGSAYAWKKMLKLALDDLNLHLCVDRMDAEVAFWRGFAYEETFEWKRAVDEYELAIQLDNSYVYAFVGMARLQACCPDESFRDGARSLENAQKACALTDGSDWNSLSVIAAAHAELDNFREAVRFARKAADLAPVDEEETRLARIGQYEGGKPFRLPGADS